MVKFESLVKDFFCTAKNPPFFSALTTVAKLQHFMP